jgi:hypothetical protein
MNANDVPEEKVELSDAVFEQGPLLPAAPADPAGDAVPAAPAEARPEDPLSPPPRAPSETSPLRDYVRELQQEFVEQEEEGKL